MSKLEQTAGQAAELIKTTAQQTKMALNIEYIQKDIVEIKQTLKEQSNTFVNRAELVEIVRVQEDHEKRTRILEQSMAKYIAMASVIAALISIIIPIIVKLLFKI